MDEAAGAGLFEYLISLRNTPDSREEAALSKLENLLRPDSAVYRYNGGFTPQPPRGSSQAEVDSAFAKLYPCGAMHVGSRAVMYEMLTCRVVKAMAALADPRGGVERGGVQIHAMLFLRVRRHSLYTCDS